MLYVCLLDPSKTSAVNKKTLLLTQFNKSHQHFISKMAMDVRDRRELSQQLDLLKQTQGNGTSLISLYIPASVGQQSRANDLIKKELTQCQSIKDRAVRNAVKVNLFCFVLFCIKVCEFL